MQLLSDFCEHKRNLQLQSSLGFRKGGAEGGTEGQGERREERRKGGREEEGGRRSVECVE